MEKRIKEYEKFLKHAIRDRSFDPAALVAYHRDMVAAFQHERLVHLIVTLFFAAFAFVVLGISGLAVVYLDGANLLLLSPIFILAMLLVVLTAFYVKHYYFLETHIQKLYDYTGKIYGME